MIHRINIFLICIFVALNPIFLINSANAASLGGWSLSNPIAQGASTLYQGAKTAMINGANVAKTSTALITPVAKDVSKVLVRGVAGLALSVAVEQLLGSVDWVLDPANNQIKYKVPPSDPNSPSSQFYYISNYTNLGKFSTAEDAGRAAAEYSCTLNNYKECTYSGLTYEGKVIYWNLKHKTGSLRNRITSVANPAYDPTTEEQEKTLPLDVVSAQVISNAESGDTNAQVATTTASADIVKDAEKDDAKAKPIVNQLEANSKTETDESAKGETKPKDPAKPEAGSDLSIEFPVFCGWAPTVCEAATTVISFPQTLTNWWETSTTAISEAWADVKDWVKTEEPIDRETKVDLEVPVPPELPSTDYLQWNAYCPFNSKSDQVTIGGETTSIDSDLSSWCTMASEVRPFVLMAGAIASLMIVSGVSMRGDD